MSELKTLNGYKFVDTDARESINALNEDNKTVPALRRKVLAMSGGLYHLRRDHDGLAKLNFCEVTSVDNLGFTIKSRANGYTVRMRTDDEQAKYALTNINGCTFKFNSVFAAKQAGSIALKRLVVDGI